jgi:hypothetical protein
MASMLFLPADAQAGRQAHGLAVQRRFGRRGNHQRAAQGVLRECPGLGGGRGDEAHDRSGGESTAVHGVDPVAVVTRNEQERPSAKRLHQEAD